MEVKTLQAHYDPMHDREYSPLEHDPVMQAFRKDRLMLDSALRRIQVKGLRDLSRLRQVILDIKAKSEEIKSLLPTSKQEGCGE